MKKKSEKGAVTLFIIIAGMSFIAFLTAIFAIGAVRNQTQIEANKQSKSIYTKEDANTIYNGYFGEGTIPIYTGTQLCEMCSGHDITINEEGGKIYTFSSNAAYILMNNIVFEYNGVWNFPSFTGTGRCEGNGKEIKIKDTSQSGDVYYYYKEYNNYSRALNANNTNY